MKYLSTDTTTTLDMHLAKHGLEFVIDPHGGSQLTRRAGSTSGDLVRHLDNGYELTLCCSINNVGIILTDIHSLSEPVSRFKQHLFS